jgi:hypothetical protein
MDAQPSGKLFSVDELKEKTAAENPTNASVTHEREQPWKSLVDAIEKENKDSPIGKDFFPCADGFYAHSLAG